MYRLLAIPLLVLSVCGNGFGQPASRATRIGPPNRMMLERLNRLPAPERDRVLGNLPPERKAHIQERLGRFNAMPAEQKERLKKEYDAFQELPAEKQRRVRQLYRSLNDMPNDRRGPVTREYASLRSMSADDRKERLASVGFKARFSSSEQELLENLSDLMLAPPVAAGPDKVADKVSDK